MVEAKRVARAKTADFLEVLEHLRVEVPASGQIVCPFHDDHRPSMKLYEQSGYCFACHKHADAIEFVREVMDLSFVEAVNFLLDNFETVEPEDPEKIPAVLPPKEHLFGMIPREHLIEASEFVDQVEFAYSAGELSRTEAAREILTKFKTWSTI